MKTSILKTNFGFSLVELVAGTFVTGVLIWLGTNFIFSAQTSQANATLKIQANGELLEFFNNRKKSFSKVKPGAIPLNSTGPLSTLTIPRTSYDSDFKPSTSNEVITVLCGDLPQKLSGIELPNDFTCPGLCSGSQLPFKVSISVDGAQGETYPARNPDSFPDGEIGSKLAASLCLTQINNSLVFKMTYLVFGNNANDYSTVSREEVFNIPADNGIAKPQVIGR